MEQVPEKEQQEQIKGEITGDLVKERVDRKKRGKIILGIVAVLLLAAVAFAYYEFGAEIFKQNALDGGSQQPAPTATGTDIPTTTPETTYNPDAYANSQCQNRLGPVAGKSEIVEWTEPKKIENFHIYFFSPNGSQDENGNYTAQYQDVSYVVGKVKSGKYQGGEFILTQVIPDGPSAGERYRLIRKDGTYYYLEKYSDPLPDPQWGAKFVTALIKDSEFDLPDLNFPEKLLLDTPKAEFSYVKTLGFFRNGNDFFCADNLVKVFTHSEVGDVYTDSNELPTINGRQGFYIKGGDASLRTYQLVVPIVDDKNVPLITWKDGKANTDEYTYQTVGGCGASNFRDIANIKESTLVSAGTAFDGKAVYVYKDQNAEDLKNLYDGIYLPEGETKITYAQFIAGRPVFFWKDAFDKLLRFKNKKFIPLAECGKPVIYLYPTSTQKVSVNVSPQGGMSYSDPLYNGGWSVVADTNSNITNLADGKTYPYLFWEGRGGLYETPGKGFVVEKEKVHSLLEEKLSLFGLNEKERKDFEEYWEPKMQSAPYYFVTFMGNQVMDGLAPLEITPKPDTVIRVLMDFKPLVKPISVQGYNIRTPVRKGFTVVEWGGVLR